MGRINPASKRIADITTTIDAIAYEGWVAESSRNEAPGVPAAKVTKQSTPRSIVANRKPTESKPHRSIASLDLAGASAIGHHKGDHDENGFVEM